MPFWWLDGLETHGKQERQRRAKPWRARDGRAAMQTGTNIRQHAEALIMLLWEDPDGEAPTGESREVFARDTMAALEAEVQGLREALGVAPGFSGRPPV